MVKRTDPKTGRKYDATSRKGKQIWEEMKKKKARLAKHVCKNKNNKNKNNKCKNNKCGTKKNAGTSVQKNKLNPIKAVKNGGVRLSASYYYNVTCNGKISKCEPQAVLQPNGNYIMKKIRIVNGQSGPEPRWVKA